MTLLERIRVGLLGIPLQIPPTPYGPALPRDVTLRQGDLVPRIGGLLTRMHGPAAAVTLGDTIVVHPSITLSPELLAHELEHVRQWREDALFPIRYALATLRYGYHNNPYEVAARAAARAAVNPTRTED